MVSIKLLEPARRAHLAAEDEVVVAGVPPDVTLARLDGENLAGAGLDLLAVDLGGEPAVDDLEPLGLIRVPGTVCSRCQAPCSRTYSY
jgi:hypothetical protein